ncbi:ABC transporter ATP-binding protein [Dorea sp. OM02-2LB]|jgi:multiple sugar transport system ATP-binding protein|nr:ABC transporter ATP-binding protein [Dorea sp. OM02-2LB]
MASLTFKNLCKTYPNGFASVKDFSLEVADGSLVTLYGPHGCGKSTILRMIGGLEDITSGKIYLGDDLLNDIYPRDRKLAMAFQNYRLYGHLNVYENIALGLRLRSLPRNVIESRVRTAAEFFGITDILTRKIRTLSEIHKQCVALSRALVCKPKVLLIDEDFSHQDEKLRERMLADMIRIHREFHLTMLYVTNDYNEAIRYGNLTVFMRSGQILEVRENPDF